METLSIIITIGLLIPYVGWGIYTLSQRFHYHEEAGTVIEAATLLGVLLFLVIQVALLRTWLVNSPLLYVFTILGLMVSVAALYGHTAVSFTSRLIVETVSAGDDTRPDSPRLGPVEALERQRDFEGALQECYIIARIYPRDPSVHLHTAENLLHLDRPQEAAEALERALRYVEAPEKNLLLLNRLCEVLIKHLEEPERAAELLERFLARHPDTAYAEDLRNRVHFLREGRQWEAPAELASLDEAPVEEIGEEEVWLQESPTTLPSPGLVALEEAPMMDEEAVPQYSLPERPATSATLGLAALDEVPIEELPEDLPSASDAIRGGLQALDEVPIEEELDTSVETPLGTTRLELEPGAEPRRD